MASIEQYAGLKQYLIEVRGKLEARKGTLIRSAIAKGVWWSLLGVGPYSFAPYKVIWEAYGKSDFQPVILNSAEGQMWQANQAMQAFIPCWNRADAKRICAGLQHPGIPVLLRELNGEGNATGRSRGRSGRFFHWESQKLINKEIFMKKTIWIALLVVFGTFGWGHAQLPDAPNKVRPLMVGDEVPALTLVDADGRRLTWARTKSRRF